MRDLSHPARAEGAARNIEDAQMIPRRGLGDTGVHVSAIGLGCGGLGRHDVDEAQVAAVIGTAIDVGVTLFDAARSYDLAEERLGRHLAPHRSDILLSTKVGYGIEGHEDWTGPCITAGIEEALTKLRTDVIDIVHLHSCPRDVLERGEVTAALDDAASAGKIRFAAYSGENDALAYAVTDPRFRVVQSSVNICDQHSVQSILPGHADRLGVIAKRSIANAFWRFDQRPVGDYAELYWHRWSELGLTDLDPRQVALRFSAFAPGVDVALVGTTSPAHLRDAAEQVAAGPLDASVADRLLAAVRGRDWPGDI